MARKIKQYPVHPFDLDAKLAAEVTKRRQAAESVSAIAKDLGMGTGRTALAVLVGTTERVTGPDAQPLAPEALARAVVKDRKAGASWGLLMARYRVTEGSLKAAYEAAAGQPYSSIDHRTKKES